MYHSFALIFSIFGYNFLNLLLGFLFTIIARSSSTSCSAHHAAVLFVFWGVRVI
jgi:hypothetical protein